MKKIYISPKLVIADFLIEDIITASGAEPASGYSVLGNGRQLESFSDNNDSVVANIWS